MNIIDKYIIARWCYAIGVDYIDDIEYRELEDEVKKIEPENEYLKRSWSNDPCPIELLEKYNMQHLYRDLKFTYVSESIPSINSQSEFEEKFRGLKKSSRLSFKLDGWSVQVNYFNGKPISAETRGRTGNSMNANVVLSIVPQQISEMGKVKITGELVIPNDKWKLMQLDYDVSSQRNAVSTCLANERAEYLEFVAFNIQSEDTLLCLDPYTMLGNMGFKTPYFVKVENYMQLLSGMKVLAKINRNYNYPNDGLVLENEDYQYALRVGDWQEEVLQSYVVGYAEKHGAYGNTMIVEIKPIEHNGAKRKQVSVTNLQYILDFNLEVGAPIAFDIRSMAIAVLNQTRTLDLQKQYEGNYEEFRKMVDERGA
ncbi:MAG: hypothetical protein IJE43_19185 [Alphaproteobacteria bacterium]|nr:hypothetical protein [Alphaproteobacteria bacterium]